MKDRAHGVDIGVWTDLLNGAGFLFGWHVARGSQHRSDARVLGTCLLDHGVTADALAAYDEKLCGPVSEVILRNRGAGPFGLLNMVDERCGGEFDNIDDVIPADERAEFMAKYKAAAGFAIEKLNNDPRTIPVGATVRLTEQA